MGVGGIVVGGETTTFYRLYDTMAPRYEPENVSSDPDSSDPDYNDDYLLLPLELRSIIGVCIDHYLTIRRILNEVVDVEVLNQWSMINQIPVARFSDDDD